MNTGLSRSESPERAQLRRELDRVADRGRSALTRHRLAQAAPRAIAAAMPLLFIAPCGFLLFRALLLVASPGASTGAPFYLVLAILLPFVLATLAPLVLVYARRPARSEAIAFVDKSLELQDRLIAAEDFMARPAADPFMEAAIDDAGRFAGEASRRPLPAPPALPLPPTRHWLWPVAGAAVLTLAFLLHGEARLREMVAGRSTEVAQRAAESRPDAALAASREPAGPQAEEEQRPETETRSRPLDRTAREAGQDVGEQMKKAEGRTKSGETTDAGAPTGGTQAKGQPTDQGQPAKGVERPKNSRVSKPKPPQNAAEAARKTVKDQSGATAGRGAAGGSNKNPVASEWTSRDQPPPGDEDPKTEDEELDDENEGDEARGGLQPSLRDRKPPTSRDLGMGLGNRPGGEGRGGPSEPKKSRGTASLVLGVPIADHVKGQVNKGTTKITQERVEPEAEDAAPITASERAPRSLPSSSRELRALPLWLRAVTRTYFLDRVQKEQSLP